MQEASLLALELMLSLVIFAVQVKKVANFYEQVTGAIPRPGPGDNNKDVRLSSDGCEILIHSISARLAKKISLQNPPLARSSSALKPIFDLINLTEALETVVRLGGVITDMRFTLDGRTRQDIIDPEGNVVQLRGVSQ